MFACSYNRQFNYSKEGGSEMNECWRQKYEKVSERFLAISFLVINPNVAHLRFLDKFLPEKRSAILSVFWQNVLDMDWLLALFKRSSCRAPLFHFKNVYTQ